MQSQHEAELEQTFGPLARNREHNPGERITYRLPGSEGDFQGRIIWACEATYEVGMCYIVERDDAGNSFPDIVFPAFVLAAL